MAVIRVVTPIAAPVERCFDLARDIDFHVRSMAHTGERAVLGRTTGLIGLGESVTLEARHLGVRQRITAKVTEFDFLDFWRVRIDGVAFGDMGRVFFDDSALNRQFRLNRNTLPRVFEDFRYSYGAGARIALGEAILARIDVGFSDEETGLVYLAFGHTF